ncbi:retrovirus-related Pol polyprotein LINE-1 [Elysia marginata]|uniref:Retrovirus-related Pol polyprotein LINE-1 n=1 Tax=Elysia marginata TaxID=1093978 RepID=A0AAV4IX37_9GAST|nr:retrovirus-related Pol polyprotein LINE-1 [Elysia marginata]
MKSARKSPSPFTVHYMTHDVFMDFSEIGPYTSIPPGKKTGDPTVTDVHRYKYTMEDNNGRKPIQYNLRFSDEWQDIPAPRDFASKKVGELKQLYQERLQIPKTKYNHLQAFKAVIGSMSTVLFKPLCIWCSPVLFNIFLERIMQDALHQHSPTISIGGRPICNLRFADDIDLIAGSQAELQVLTDRLVASSKKLLEWKSLVSSILTYGCETWTLLADTEGRIQAFEKCLRKLLRISYKDHVTNESVRELVVAYVGPQEPLLATVKRRKLAWFGHVTRHDSLSKTILQGTVEGKRRRGRQKKAWCGNIKEWTGMVMYELVRSASDRDAWRQKTDPSALRSPDDPTGRGTE